MIKLKTYITPKAYIKESQIQGKGLFAKEPIEVGEVVVQFGGYYANKTEAIGQEKQGKLVMQWDENVYSIETRGDDDGYFINHSCDSDLWMKDAYTLVAKRDIFPEEEITADYALWEFDPNFVSEWECRCEKSDCRRKVTGSDYKKEKVKNKYKNHFSPLINKLLKK